MSTTAIEWTDAVWNPVTGCTKVSAGCKHCYAERMAMRRMAPEWRAVADNLIDDPVYRDGNPDHDGLRLRMFADVRCHPERLDQPLRWRKPRRVFVDSMSDLFHPDVPDAFIDGVFKAMSRCPRHVFQVLTKRPERMLRIVPIIRSHYPDRLEHVWLGVSVEDQATADKRVDLLLQTPAARRFVSCEPLLGPVDLTSVGTTSDSDPGYSALELRPDDEGDLLETLDWVIVGGESGPQARPCSVEWIGSIVRQCKAADVPVFVKQLGAWACFGVPGQNGGYPTRNRKHSDPSEWPEDLRVRERPKR